MGGKTRERQGWQQVNRCRNKRAIQENAEDYLEEYDGKMVEDLIYMFGDMLAGYSVKEIDEDKVEEIWMKWKEELPDPDEWSYNRAMNSCIDAEEARADAKRDDMMRGNE